MSSTRRGVFGSHSTASFRGCPPAPPGEKPNGGTCPKGKASTSGMLEQELGFGIRRCIVLRAGRGWNCCTFLKSRGGVACVGRGQNVKPINFCSGSDLAYLPTYRACPKSLGFQTESMQQTDERCQMQTSGEGILLTLGIDASITGAAAQGWLHAMRRIEYVSSIFASSLTPSRTGRPRHYTQHNTGRPRSLLRVFADAGGPA
jgi:hypothetical protein